MSRVLSFNTSALDSAFYIPVKLSGEEKVNAFYQYQLIVKTPDANTAYAQKAANADLTCWLGAEISVAIELDGKTVGIEQIHKSIYETIQVHVGKGTRYISGMITAAEYLYDQGRSAYYSVTIQPSLFQASLRLNYRIFQNQNVITILKTLIEPYLAKVDWRLSDESKEHRYPIRDYTVQYGETDYAFIKRLCAEWGINIWFEHGQDTHTLVCSDHTNAHKKMTSEAYQEVAYYPPHYKIAEEYLHEFNLATQMVSGAYVSTDYCYVRPKLDILNTSANPQPYPESDPDKQNKKETAKVTHELFAYPATVVQPKAGSLQIENDPISEQDLRTQWNLERAQQHHFTATAKGYIRGLATGHRFTLKHHRSQAANREWVVTGTDIVIMDLAEESQRSENQGHQNDLTNQKWFVECQLTLTPDNVPIRPIAISKPEGKLQNARVVGHQKDSIYTDYLGRIKVQFYWDRYGTQDQNSSCWVRINEPWAGSQMGAVFTPRVGQEVLIDFMNNDPDLPVCIGKVNNGQNLPPWKLTENQALSGLRSREIGENQAGNSVPGRGNHLVLDDTRGHIQTQLKSDHAHSSLSLGDIYRVQSNKGRQEGRGKGFELRTDEWGSTRAAKGLYLSTFPREAAKGASMDAFEAQELLTEAKTLVEKLSHLAKNYDAEMLSGAEPLNLLSQITHSALPKHPLATTADSILNAILPDNLPNNIKARATEKILENLATQVLPRPIIPINPLSDPKIALSNDVSLLFNQYANEMAQYQQEVQEYQHNIFDQARKKIDELKPLPAAEKNDKLLNDNGIKDIFNRIKVDHKNYAQLQKEVEPYHPSGFEENVILAAGEAGIALVTPKETHQYSATKHTITTGGDFNSTVGNSWLSSIGNKFSLFVQQGIKIFSGKGQIQIKAHNHDIEIIAEKVLKLISTQEIVEIAAAKGILLTSGDAYIQIKDGDIKLHAPGEIDAKGSSHLMDGPTSKSYIMPPKARGDNWIAIQKFDDDRQPIPDLPYRLIFADGTTLSGTLNHKGFAEHQDVPAGTATVEFEEPELHDEKDSQSLNNRLNTLLGGE